MSTAHTQAYYDEMARKTKAIRERNMAKIRAQWAAEDAAGVNTKIFQYHEIGGN